MSAPKIEICRDFQRAPCLACARLRWIGRGQLVADKMRLYAGDEDVDLEELERALTIVRRKMDNPEACPGFLENPEVRGSC